MTKKNKLIRVLKDRSGATYIEMVIGILIFVLAIVFAIKFLPVLILKNQLNTFATQVSKIVSVEGCYDSNVQEMIEELRVKSEIGNVTIAMDGTDFISGTKKIQLDNEIDIKVTTQYDIGIFTFGSFPITVKSVAQARSDAYWK